MLAEQDASAERGARAPAWLPRAARARRARVRRRSASRPRGRKTGASRTSRRSPTTPFRLAGGRAPTNAASLVSRVRGARRGAAGDRRTATSRRSCRTSATLPVGLRIGSLARRRIAHGRGPSAAPRPAAASTRMPFAALNTAFLEDGALIAVRQRRRRSTRPIHIVIITGGAGKTMAHPRMLIVAGANSQVRIAQTLPRRRRRGALHQRRHRSRRSARARSSSCYTDQREHRARVHIATSRLHVQRRRDSSFESHAITLGGRIVRNDAIGRARPAKAPHVHARTALSGRRRAAGRQPHHASITRCRTAPATSSTRASSTARPRRCSTAGSSSALDAQKTDAKQTNRALLLSDDATDQLEPAARDLRRRREVHARRGGRAARRRGACSTCRRAG